MNKEQRLKKYAIKNLGKPYKYGAKLYEAPKVFDCSSFVQYLYKRISVDLPRTALEQARLGKKIQPKKENLRIGDLIFIKGSWGHYDPEFPEGVGHVAVYIGDGKIIHAKHEKNDGKVKLGSLSALLKRKDVIVIKRII